MGLVKSNWLTEELKLRIRKIYEPKYRRKLTEEEVVEIGENLAGLVEIVLKVKSKGLIKNMESLQSN